MISGRASLLGGLPGLLLLLLLLVLCTGCQRAVTGPPKALEAQPKAGQCVVNMQVTGMTCDFECPPKIFTALDLIDGVDEVFVDYERKRAGVLATGTACDENALPQYPAAIKTQGFDARILEVIRG